MEREKLETAALDSGHGRGRRLVWVAAAIAVLLQIGALLWSASPLPNNSFTNATQFPARAYAVLNTDNRGARTVQPELGLPRTVWFKWTLPRNVSPGDTYEVTFSTKGSKFDTKMKVFMGGQLPSIPHPANPQAPLTMFAGNDNAKTGPWSEVTLRGGRNAGVSYIINPKNNQPVPVSSLLVGVGGVDGAQGDIRISAQRKKK